MRIVSVNRAALALGLSHGLTLADARARAPQLLAVDTDARADTQWLERIADFCDRYTPMVALDAPHGLVLDIAGCAHLFGGEEALRDDLGSRLSPQLSRICTAIASTPQAARALARFGGEDVVVTPGMEARAVAPLPVAALEAGEETTTALRRAGLKTVGDVASRPRPPLAARFGSGLVARLARLLGEENTGMTPRRPLPPCSVERRFAEPVSRIEDALAALEALAGQAETALERRGEGGRCFEASLFRSDGAVSRLTVETAAAVRAPPTVMRLFGERIDTLHDPLDPGHGYDLIRLSVTETAPFAAVQQGLDGNELADADITALVDRLGTRFGRHAVVRFVPVHSHIPERATQAVPAGQAPARETGWPSFAADARPRRPVHLFERPEPVEAVAEIPDGPPLKFRWRRVLHEVARAEGPERIAPQWWEPDTHSPTRDYYCVESSKGHRFWIFRDGLYHEMEGQPRWFVHGLFA